MSEDKFIIIHPQDNRPIEIINAYDTKHKRIVNDDLNFPHHKQNPQDIVPLQYTISNPELHLCINSSADVKPDRIDEKEYISYLDYLINIQNDINKLRIEKFKEKHIKFDGMDDTIFDDNTLSYTLLAYKMKYNASMIMNELCRYSVYPYYKMRCDRNDPTKLQQKYYNDTLLTYFKRKMIEHVKININRFKEIKIKTPEDVTHTTYTDGRYSEEIKFYMPENIAVAKRKSDGKYFRAEYTVLKKDRQSNKWHIFFESSHRNLIDEADMRYLKKIIPTTDKFN